MSASREYRETCARCREPLARIRLDDHKFKNLRKKLNLLESEPILDQKTIVLIWGGVCVNKDETISSS